MPIDEKIIECEIEYSKCFSQCWEDENIIRFRDDQLKDMYSNNYTYIKRAVSEIELKHIIEDEISMGLSEKSKFCNIVLAPGIDISMVPVLGYNPEKSTKGFYSFDISRFSGLNALPGCIIKKVDNKDTLDDLLFCDLVNDEIMLGRDFCTRRCYRRGKVYISSEGVNCYVCYHNGSIIGNCDLFIHNGTAKIEDFAVIPEHQRKGYGTTILKYLIDTALKENCHTIYLDTDEDDTAKEMYQKIGFTKIGERVDLFFRL